MLSDVIAMGLGILSCALSGALEGRCRVLDAREATSWGSWGRWALFLFGGLITTEAAAEATGARWVWLVSPLGDGLVYLVIYLVAVVAVLAGRRRQRRAS